MTLLELAKATLERQEDPVCVVEPLSQNHTTYYDLSPWPPRSPELARWSAKRRQRWGELANRFEEEGIPFPESERRAFEQVKAEMGAAER